MSPSHEYSTSIPIVQANKQVFYASSQYFVVDFLTDCENFIISTKPPKSLFFSRLNLKSLSQSHDNESIRDEPLIIVRGWERAEIFVSLSFFKRKCHTLGPFFALALHSHYFPTFARPHTMISGSSLTQFSPRTPLFDPGSISTLFLYMYISYINDKQTFVTNPPKNNDIFMLFVRVIYFLHALPCSD